MHRFGTKFVVVGAEDTRGGDGYGDGSAYCFWSHSLLMMALIVVRVKRTNWSQVVLELKEWWQVLLLASSTEYTSCSPWNNNWLDHW